MKKRMSAVNVVIRKYLIIVSLLIPVLFTAGCGNSVSKEAASVILNEKEVVAYGNDVSDKFTDGELADMLFEALDDENFANGAVDLGYTAESLNDRINAMKNEGVYVKLGFDAPYTHGAYTFKSVIILGNPTLLGVEFQLDSQCYGYASDIAKVIAKKADK